MEYLRPGADEMAAKAVQTSFRKLSTNRKEIEGIAFRPKILMSSSPYDETTKGKGNYYPGKSKAMLRVAAFQEAAAKKNNWSFVDLNRSYDGHQSAVPAKRFHFFHLWWRPNPSWSGWSYGDGLYFPESTGVCQ